MSTMDRYSVVLNIVILQTYIREKKISLLKKCFIIRNEVSEK